MGNKNQSFRICSYENASVSTLQVPVSLSGTNNANYYILANAYTISISIQTPTLPPSFSFTPPSNYDAGTGIFTVTSTLNGNYYYSAREGSYSSDPYTFPYYLNMTNNNNDTI